MIGRIGGFLGGLSSTVLAWAAVAAGTVIAGLMLVVALQARVIQGKSEDVGQAKERTKAAMQAASNNESIAFDLGTRLQQCVKEKQASAEAERQANAALERKVAEINQGARDEREARETIYATDESCDAWRDAPVCDGIADRLRLRAARPLGHDDRGSGAGDGVDPGATD